MNFQSWKVSIKDTEVKPPFSVLAMESKAYVDGEPDPLTISQVELFDASIANSIKSEIIATIMTAMIFDERRMDPEARPLHFNFDQPESDKPLKNYKIWQKRWQQKRISSGEFVDIDLAAKIEEFYVRENGSNLTADVLLDSDFENTFIVKTKDQL